MERIRAVGHAEEGRGDSIQLIEIKGIPIPSPAIGGGVELRLRVLDSEFRKKRVRAWAILDRGWWDFCNDNLLLIVTPLIPPVVVVPIPQFHFPIPCEMSKGDRAGNVGLKEE